MFDAWQEHVDHEMGCATDAQNALAWNRMNHDNGMGKVNDLVASGRFVVVAQWTAYCPSTDAIMGSNYAAEADFATREEAETYINKNYDGFHDPEVDIYILPRPPAPRPDDFYEDIPF